MAVRRSTQGTRKAGPRTIVVVGGALAGPTAAARAREVDENARIVVLERAPHVSYAVGGIGAAVGREVHGAALDTRGPTYFRDTYAVEVRTGTSVQAIDAKKKVVSTSEGAIPYDALVFALGVESVVPKLPGVAGAANAVGFRTLEDLGALEAALAGGRRRVAVLGGGFFGVEAADACARRGLEVTLLERGPELLGGFTPELARRAAAALAARGVRVRTGARVTEAAREGTRVAALRIAGAPRLDVDAVIVAAGVAPRTALLAKAGARRHPSGALLVDGRARTSLPDVYACGTCVAVPSAVTGKPVWSPQAALADKTAQVAGENAAGGRARLGRTTGTALVRAGDLLLGRTGLGPADARALAGKALATTLVHAPAADPFVPGAAPLAVALHHHARTGRLLGAEVAGSLGADKRLDVLATALAGGLGLEELANLDLAYAAPASAARDPVNVAARVALAARAGRATPWTAPALAGGGRRGRPVVVDVRTSQAGGTIAGARHLPLARLRTELASLPAGPLVFVDDSGRDAYLAARIATARGRRAAGFLVGGLSSWRSAGQPLVAA